MRSDRSKMETVLRNLIHNALKYTEHGNRHASAPAARDTGGGPVRGRRHRTGHRRRPISTTSSRCSCKGDNSGPPREGGVGLGLYVVSRLTQALGGEVTVESRLGEGSRFSVAIPLVAPH